MPGNEPAPKLQPKTLMETHDALVHIRPSRDADLEQWQAYYHRSAVLYAQIADIDRGHHHEALYWA
ncbi:MAG: AMED_5909 family protein, partial [Pseudonocardiaceae bacterium]